MAKSSKKNLLLKLPQVDEEIWFVATHPMRAWVPNDDGQFVRPMIRLIINASTGFILGVDTNSSVVETSEVRNALFDIMSLPNPMLQHTPHRPTHIYVEDPALVDGLKDELAAIDVNIRPVDRPDEVNEILREMESNMPQDSSIPGLLDVEGVTPDLVAELFSAAAEFYREEPWRFVSDEHPLLVKLRAGKRDSDDIAYYTVIMGAAGMQYGLAIYKKWADLEALYGFIDEPQELLGTTGARSLTFDEMHYVPFDDLDAIDEYGWEVEDEQAYPVPMIIMPDETVHRPSLEELRWYIAALRAIPTFVNSHLKTSDSGDFEPADEVVTVAVAGEVVQVQITYPAGTLPPRQQRPAGKSEWPGLQDDADELVLPDRRGMEGTMAQVVGQSTDSPESRAQEIMYEAWEEQNPARRIILAHEALEISPNCADAYVLLAEEEADTVGRSLDYYEQGVAAGERALGETIFKEAVGHFWMMLETRPYMRARRGLAETLWGLGKFEEARDHMNELLYLNPNDNQGIRYSLLNLLLEAENYDDAQELLDAYDDGMAEWFYTEALLAFHFDGDSEYPNEALKEALAMNKHVPAYLNGRKKIPVQLPARIGIGDENEAKSYASRYLKAWRNVPDALAWLKKQSK